jgi:hypothetical protein
MLVEHADGFGLFIGEREVKIVKFEELLATLSSSGQVWVKERARWVMGGRSESGVPRGSGSRVGQTDGVDGSGNWRWMNRRCTEIRIRWFGNRRVMLEIVVRLREAMRGWDRGGVGYMVSRGRRRCRGERGERGRRGRKTGAVLEELLNKETSILVARCGKRGVKGRCGLEACSVKVRSSGGWQAGRGRTRKMEVNGIEDTPLDLVFGQEG